MKQINLLSLILGLFLFFGKSYGQFNVGAGFNYFAIMSDQGYKSPMVGIMAGYLAGEKFNISTSIRFGGVQQSDLWAYPASGRVLKAGLIRYSMKSFSLSLEYWAEVEENVILFPLLEISILSSKVKDYSPTPDYVGWYDDELSVRDIDGNKDVILCAGGGLYYRVAENILVGGNLSLSRLSTYVYAERKEPIKDKFTVLRAGVNVVYMLSKKE